jgi:hypothetical protein
LVSSLGVELKMMTNLTFEIDHIPAIGRPPEILDGMTRLTCEDIYNDGVSKEEAIGKEGCLGRCVNVSRILYTSVLCGLLSYATCMCCCFGFCGNCDTCAPMILPIPELKDKLLETEVRRELIALSHITVSILASPVGCATCCLCAGCCGKGGPMQVAYALQSKITLFF